MVDVDVDVDTARDEALPGLRRREQEIITRADALGRGPVAENAASIDLETVSPRMTLHALAAAGLAGITVPRRYGGDEVGDATYLRVLEGLSYGDGTTPFIIAQHYGTALILAQSANEALQRAMLPGMATGQALCGFGISQVRRAGRPALAAVPHGDGYRFDGTIPWMTGYGLFSHVVIAGTLPGGESLLAWLPFRESGEMRFGAPMRLVAMSAARTVAATCEALVVRREDVVMVEPAGRRTGANRTAPPCLYGIARASIDDLAALAERRKVATVAAAAARLGDRLAAQRRVFYATLGQEEHDGPRAESLLAEVRAAATALALDAVAALIVATGGGANAATHPAQRRLREISVFTTWGLSVASVDTAVTTLAG